MADQFIQVPADSTGKKVDTSELTVGANTVERQRINISDANTAAAIAPVTNTAPTGSAYGLAVRNVPEKQGQTLSTATLAGNGVYTQGWQDANADGTTFVEAQAFANQASAASGFVIQESDDTGNANLTRTVASASVSVSTLATIWAPIRSRFWRVQYTNGGSAQGSFEITCSAAPVAAYGVNASGVLQVDGSGVTQPVSGTVTANAGAGTFNISAIPAGTNNIGGVELIDSGGTNKASISAAGAVKVDGSAVTQPVSGTVTANAGSGTFTVGGTVTANLAPPTSGGCSDYHVVAAASTNAANIKASAGQIFTVSVFNNAAYPVFVKFYNTAGTPTVGTGVVHTVGVQAGTLGGWSNPNGYAFSTGIGISITKGIADADATAVALSDCVVDVQYK